MEAKQLAERISQLILEKKGEDVVLQDLRNITNMADFFVICSVDVDVQAKAIIDHIREELLYESIKPWHTEGKPGSNWVLLDFVDVVVHIFKKEARKFYALERLWGDAKITHVKDTDETSRTHPSAT